MMCSVYPSRPFLLTTLALLVLVLAAWGCFVSLKADSPTVAARIVTCGFFAVALLACLVGLLVKQPLLRVDETGIAYHPKRFPKIEWADVLDVERVPLIEPTPDGLINHLREDWRPVNIFVTGSDKYLRRLPATMRQRQNVDKMTDAVRFRFAFVGRSPASAEVYECIRRHLDRRGMNV